MTTYRQYQQPKVYLWPTDDDADRFDLGGDTVSLQVSRMLGQIAGTIAITVLPRTERGGPQTPADIRRLATLYQTARPMNVVSVGVDEGGGLGLGVVSRIQQTKVYSGGQVQSGLTLICQDLGRLLTQDSIVLASLIAQAYNPFIQKIRAALGDKSPFLVPFSGARGAFAPTVDGEGAKTFYGVSVQDAVKFLVENAPSIQIPLLGKLLGLGGNGGRLGDYLDTSRSVTTWNQDRLWSDSLSTFNGSLYEFLRRLVDPDFYEIYLEYKPIYGTMPRPMLIIRPKPFDESAMQFAPTRESPGITWNDLRTLCDDKENHDISPDEILAEQLGYGDGSVSSYYLVLAKNSLLGNEDQLRAGVAYPLVDTWAAKRFGVRPYRATLSLLGGNVTAQAEGTASQEAFEFEAHEFRNRLFNWYRLNPFFEEGQITVVGRDRYRIGDPVRLLDRMAPRGDERGMRYYCTGTSWSWAFGQPYTTTLTLSRGHNNGMVRALKADILADAPATNPLHYASY